MDSAQLKDVGLKATLPRLKVLEVFQANPAEHYSAEDVYRLFMENGDDVGLATIYRVLTQFEAAGLVVRHNFEGGHAVFEFDSGEHHDHILCIECGTVTEFMDQTIEKRQHKVAEDNQFELADHSLVLYGRCKRTNCPNRT
ncbi:MAG: ferric iron uptake transcriptional regulator [Chromatiales bacterium]|mgnify:CR=1 FL=1|jgi:Fur family transcriptional regulator, ferric uptake regulator|nr:ferric iron uptake transcriptional regulator [Chromatiales bacterium]